jgi:hypothetical protein
MEVLDAPEKTAHSNELHAINCQKVIFHSTNQRKFPSKYFIKLPVLNMNEAFKGDM